MATFEAQMQIAASDIDGTTGRFLPDGQEFEGFLLLDYDELVDRNEVLHLLRAEHHISVYANSTGTEDGSVRGMAEVSSAPALQAGQQLESAAGGGRETSDFNVEADLYDTDTIDTLGRPLQAVGFQPFSDTTNGTGGAGTEGSDTVVLGSDAAPSVIGRFHPRDELFVNGALEASNVDDAAIHLDLVGQHLYGVTSQS